MCATGNNYWSVFDFQSQTLIFNHTHTPQPCSHPLLSLALFFIFFSIHSRKSKIHLHFLAHLPCPQWSNCTRALLLLLLHLLSCVYFFSLIQKLDQKDPLLSFYLYLPSSIPFALFRIEINFCSNCTSCTTHLFFQFLNRFRKRMFDQVSQIMSCRTHTHTQAPSEV